MRTSVESHLFDVCAAADELMKADQAQALTAAMEGVAETLNAFLGLHSALLPRGCYAHKEALSRTGGVRYAATLWAVTRRNGEYFGLNVIHNLGVGAAKDGRQRSERWFASLNDVLAVLKGNDGLRPVSKTLDQIGKSASAARIAFVEAVQRAGMEVYRKPLSQAPIWSQCAGHWGAGPGFKTRVVADLEEWFENRADLRDKLEEITTSLWDQLVIAPMRRLVVENAPDIVSAANVAP
jgi:hypothetical protein